MSSTPTVFDPTRVVDGIELSDDPILRYRPGAYSESVSRRTQTASVTPVKTLVIGTGGREHALARALARDPGVTEVHAAPGQPGHGRGRDAARRRPAGRAGRSPRSPPRSASTWSWSARRRRWSPASPTRCATAGIAAFGPSGEAARLEGSKAFAKEVMDAAGVPTARRVRLHDAPRRPPPRWTSSGAPYVVKDDGLAAGKGVVVTDDRATRRSRTPRPARGS